MNLNENYFLKFKLFLCSSCMLHCCFPVPERPRSIITRSWKESLTNYSVVSFSPNRHWLLQDFLLYFSALGQTISRWSICHSGAKCCPKLHWLKRCQARCHQRKENQVCQRSLAERNAPTCWCQWLLWNQKGLFSRVCQNSVSQLQMDTFYSCIWLEECLEWKFVLTSVFWVLCDKPWGTGIFFRLRKCTFW